MATYANVCISRKSRTPVYAGKPRISAKAVEKLGENPLEKTVEKLGEKPVGELSPKELADHERRKVKFS